MSYAIHHTASFSYDRGAIDLRPRQISFTWATPLAHRNRQPLSFWALAGFCHMRQTTVLRLLLRTVRDMASASVQR
jgi:hypothetical protein